LPDPLHDVLGLGRAAGKQRRADPHDVRSIVGQADVPGKLPARSGRLPSEPAVEVLRARDDDAFPRQAVHLDSFGFLDVVPDKKPVWCVADDRLARQVVPAPHTDRRRDAARLRTSQQVEL
jgi:hypothetical protein